MTRLPLALLLFSPAACFAQDWDVSYDYIEVGYGQNHNEAFGISIDFDGYSVAASGGGEHVYTVASYSRLADSVVAGFSVDVDANEITAGIGGIFQLSSGQLLIQPALSMYIELDYVRTTASWTSLSGTENGLALSSGVRFMPGPRSEFRAGVSRYEGDYRIWESGSVAVSGNGGSTAVSVGGARHISDAVTIEAGYTDFWGNTDAHAVSVGLRIYL